MYTCNRQLRVNVAELGFWRFFIHCRVFAHGNVSILRQEV